MDALALAWPKSASHPLDSDADRDWREAARRLIEARTVLREVYGDIAYYTLAADVIGEIGGTRRPQDN